MKRRIGLFAGGIEQYWTELGMKDLPARIENDIKRFISILKKDFEVTYPGCTSSAKVRQICL